jgi:heme exporter protein A
MKLCAENLTKNFDEKTIFKNLSFKAESGSGLAVLGPNGSGKTTLMRILSHLILPTSGTIHYSENEKTISPEHLFQHIGFLGPYLELYQDLSAMENLQFFSKIRGLHNFTPRIFHLMEQFGLKGREEDLVKTYSSGMKQRLKYVFALLHEPQILFVDEPRSNLDEEGIGLVYEVLNAYKKDHLLIMATNDSEDLKLADLRVQVNV